MGLREVFSAEATDGSSSDGTSNEDIVNARASALIYDAIDGEDRPLPAHGECHLKSHLLRSRLIWFIRLWSALGMLLEFFVEPHWCLRHSTGNCPVTDPKFYMSDFPKLGQRSIWMLALNFIYLLPFALDLGLRVFAYERNFSTMPQKVYAAVVSIYAVVSFIDYIGFPTFDVLAFCRPLIFLALHHTVRREVQVVLSSIPQVLELFFLGFLLLLFFALVAIILFPITTEEGRTFFPSLATGMWSLLVLLTTANFPDVMLPAYRVSRAAFLYFFLFMIVGMFFLVNVLTAIVMSAYQRQVGVNRLNLKETRQKKLNQAYDLLTTDPDTHEQVPLTLERMDAVLEELSNFRSFETEAMYSQISAQVDTSGDGIVCRSEFGSLIWIVNKHLSQESPPPVLEKCFPKLAKSHVWQVAKSIAASDWPGFVIDILLVLNLIDMIVKLWPEIVGSETQEEAIHDRRAAIAGWVQQTFTLILVLETSFKVATIGLDRYLSTHINQFDFVITTSVVVIYLLNCLPEVLFSHATLARISQCARLFRFCRILDRYQPYHHFGRIAFKLIPPAVDVLAVVALICYAFAVLGVFLFGGLINDDPTDPHYEAVAKSSYGQADYKVNNFNDIGMGMVTLFELLVVNNWFMIADGFSAACGPGARAYFVAFWAFGVLVGLNLFLSTIIEAFTTEYEELEEADFRLPDFSEATALSSALYVDVKQSLHMPLDQSTHEPLPSYRSSEGP